MLLRVHLGLESQESAKAATGKMLLRLHERHLRGQVGDNHESQTVPSTTVVINVRATGK